MKRVQPTIFSATAILMALTMGMLTGCSSSPIGEDEIPLDDGGMAADAATDAVPEAEPEAIAGEADPVAPPVQEQPQQFDEPPAQQLAETPPPAAEPAPAPAMTPPSGDVQDYAVQAGDTLMKIAFETYGDLYRWKDIYEANRDRISDANALVAGTVLKLEKPAVAVVIERNGEKYLIKRGDTLGTISRDVYGTPARWKDIWQNNRQMIHDPNKIFAGFYLYYVPAQGATPGGVEEPQVSPAPLAQPAPSDKREPASVAPAAEDWSSSGDSGFIGN